MTQVRQTATCLSCQMTVERVQISVLDAYTSWVHRGSRPTDDHIPSPEMWTLKSASEAA